MTTNWKKLPIRLTVCFLGASALLHHFLIIAYFTLLLVPQLRVHVLVFVKASRSMFRNCFKLFSGSPYGYVGVMFVYSVI